MIKPRRVMVRRVEWTQNYGVHPESGEGVPPVSAATSGLFRPGPDGRVRGLMGARSLNIGRLDGERNATFQVSCTVISVSAHPDGGDVIVGWQGKAEVLSKRRTENDVEYNFRAPISHAVLLPVEERTFVLPSGPGGLGKTATLYGVSADGELLSWIESAAEMMDAYEGVNLLTSGPPEAAEAAEPAEADAQPADAEG